MRYAKVQLLSRFPGYRRSYGLSAVVLALSAFLGVLPPAEVSCSPPPGGGVLSKRDVLAWQAALESQGFSPGLLDGIVGPKTSFATCVFQARNDLPVTGNLSKETAEALGLDLSLTRPVIDYRIRAEDKRQVDYCPQDWNQRSQREKLLYSTLPDCLAERFHTSEKCLVRLNPDVDLASLGAGAAVRVPALGTRKVPSSVATLEIDLGRKVIVLLDRKEAVVGLVHCSVARNLTRVKRGTTRIANVVEDPVYTFDPKKWPEVKDVERTLLIPPGPRSPVGVRWIGLDHKGVGIHGTWDPARIGKTGSHGCFRLTNWDATWLASAVSVGTPVRVVDGSSVLDKLVGKHSPQ